MAPKAIDHSEQANTSKNKNVTRLNPDIPSMAGMILRMAGINLPTKTAKAPYFFITPLALVKRSFRFATKLI